MSSILTPKKTDRGWVVEMPLEMTQALGVAEGSLAVLHPKEGDIEGEILGTSWETGYAQHCLSTAHPGRSRPTSCAKAPR